MAIRTSNLLTTLSLLLLASACSHQPQPEGALWLSQAQQQANRGIQQWLIGGKIGLRSASDANTGYVNWQQCGEQFDIRLSGPLGQGAAHLWGNGQQAQLQTSEQLYSADNPEQLLAQQGWQLPVTQLLYWVRGLPAPGHAISQQDHEGFSQMGWRVDYRQWLSLDGHSLPRKAVASHPQLKVTLLLKNWSLDAECSDDDLAQQL
ncbi:lipoprotein insertase outer membrane protein LolB [Dasania marina]|uniref:lipoprotein insertase outer membrane protein LolB n=1 Tax=Dasania marina TaxID=471499 RepID=UPI00036177CA|nr:lipoprotein insertase outer membrane protein LolB [Dasania marina]